MSPLALAIRIMLTVWVTPQLEPVYMPQLRNDPHGAELRAAELAADLEWAAAQAGVPVRLLGALEHDEGGFDASRVSSEGARGRLQLLPASPWGRAWLRACASSPEQCEALNVLWGAYALRDALDACGGDEDAAIGFYRSGECVRGPRGLRTLELAEWLRVQLDPTEGSRRMCAAEERQDPMTTITMRAQHLREAGIDNVLSERAFDSIVGDMLHPSPALRGVQLWQRKRPESVLALLGAPGCGKTFAGAWLLAHHEPGVYCTAPQLCESAAAEHAHDRALWRRAMQSRVVFVDDLGAEPDASFAELVLVELLDFRRGKARTTLLAGSMSQDEFELRYGQRVVDRIQCEGVIVTAHMRVGEGAAS